MAMLLGRRMNRSGHSHALIIDVAKVGTHYSTYCCGYRGQLYSHIRILLISSAPHISARNLSENHKNEAITERSEQVTVKSHMLRPERDSAVVRKARNAPSEKQKVVLSCEQCRQRKTRCDKSNPCGACQRSHLECHVVRRCRLPSKAFSRVFQSVRDCFLKWERFWQKKLTFPPSQSPSVSSTSSLYPRMGLLTRISTRGTYGTRQHERR